MQTELPSLWKIYDKCGGKNHFRAMCRSGEGSKSKLRKRQIGPVVDRKCMHRCDVHEINKDCHDDNG